jgi:monofunctional biosynthetic peptidoglycan transglycosylase
VKRRRSLWRRILFRVAALVAGFYALCGAALLGLKWIDPPTTMVQIQRRVQAAIHRRPYRKRYVSVPLRRISKPWMAISTAANSGAALPPSRNNW